MRAIALTATICLALFAGLGLVACGGDDEDDVTTVEQTTTEVETVTPPPQTETVTPPSGGAGGGETADLPLCSEVPANVRPCRNADGSVEQ